jgi:hypothetical protein
MEAVEGRITVVLSTFQQGFAMAFVAIIPLLGGSVTIPNDLIMIAAG